jgi:hypothetical protein
MCNYLKVVNKQNKKQFKNMAITGTVNCQCSHVFILSSVDLLHADVEEKGCPEGDRGRVQVVQVTAPSRTARNTKDTGE